jgi:hypothetical protein
MRGPTTVLAAVLILLGCGGQTTTIAEEDDGDEGEMTTPPPPPPGSFGDDLAFLRRHLDDLVVLEADGGKAQIAVAPTYQGRVMTSTGGGLHGASYGWINRALIESGERREHMNAFGGEDRFWLGPEGSRFALYFEPGSPMDFEHWQVPEALDWSAWELIGRTDSEVSFRHQMTLTNYAGTELVIRVERTVRILDRASIGERLGVPLPDDVEVVGYESVNVIENVGDAEWTRRTGVPSIWILGMYKPSDEAVVILPFEPGPETRLGPVVNDAYFGEVPNDRLRAGDQAVFFRGDGASRGKIGLGPRRALSTIGAFDGERRTLTLVEYTVPETDDAFYVSSLWDPETPPFEGDVVNAYNDGPPEAGADPLGPFYELESSSPGAALAPGESLRHVHRTTHISGSRDILDTASQTHLGVEIYAIEDAFLD